MIQGSLHFVRSLIKSRLHRLLPCKVTTSSRNQDSYSADWPFREVDASFLLCKQREQEQALMEGREGLAVER